MFEYIYERFCVLGKSKSFAKALLPRQHQLVLIAFEERLWTYHFTCGKTTILKELSIHNFHVKKESYKHNHPLGVLHKTQLSIFNHKL